MKAANKVSNMKLDQYPVTMKDGSTFRMLADMSDSAAPIKASFFPGEDDDGQSTPYQTADACHEPFRAAQLIARYFVDDEDDCTDVVSVTA